MNPKAATVARQQNLRMAYLPQEVPPDLTGSVAEIVAAGLDARDRAQDRANPEDAWQRQLQVDKVISRMQLDPAAQIRDAFRPG